MTGLAVGPIDDITGRCYVHTFSQPLEDPYRECCTRCHAWRRVRTIDERINRPASGEQ